jgi:hypothetical protein
MDILDGSNIGDSCIHNSERYGESGAHNNSEKKDNVSLFRKATGLVSSSVSTPLIPPVIVKSKQRSIIAMEKAVRISTDNPATLAAKRPKKESNKISSPIQSIGGISLEDAMELSDDGIYIYMYGYICI